LRNLYCMIPTPTVNNTLQAEFWKFLNFWIWKFKESSHGPSWENLTSRVQMCLLYYGDMHMQTAVKSAPAIFTTYTGTSTCVQTITVLTNVGILRLFPGHGIMTSQKRTESGRLVYHKRGPGPLRGPVPLNWGSLERESPAFLVQLGIFEVRRSCISGSACARLGWAHAHFQVSTCTHTHQHVHTSRWVCAHVHFSTSL